MGEPKMKHISMGSDGSPWAVGAADGTLYRRYGDAGIVAWVADKTGKAEISAAIDWASGWCVNKVGEIWHLEDAVNLTVGGKWTQIPTHSGNSDASTIAVGPNGGIWYAQTDGVLYERESNVWKQDPIGRAIVISVGTFGGDEVLWCVNKAGEIWQKVADQWANVPTHSGKPDAKWVSAGSDGSVWYVSKSGELFFYVVDGDAWIKDQRWQPSYSGAAAVIAVHTQGDVLCINYKGEVWNIAPSAPGVSSPVTMLWQQVMDIGPEGKNWVYTVKAGEHLMAIVRKEFNLSDPKDSARISQLVDMIVAQNKENTPHLTRDMVKVGDNLVLRY